jgi:hypothetical protein
MQVGRGIDTYVSILCINKSIKQFDYSAVSFSSWEQEERLRKQIEEVFGKDADALFKASMKQTINNIRQSYISLYKKNPCEELSRDDDEYFREKTLRIIDENYRYLYGHGKKWATKDALFYWLRNEARGNEDQHITQTYEGDFTMTNTPLGQCYACIPPNLKGKIELTINLRTCKVQGKFLAEGNGAVTVKMCDENSNPISEECTCTGWLKLSGDIKGKVDLSTRKLNLEPVTVTYNHTYQWLACRDVSLSQKSVKGEDKFTITGGLDYSWGYIRGDVNSITNTSCQLKADWKAYRSDKTVSMETWADRYRKKHQEESDLWEKRQKEGYY